VGTALAAVLIACDSEPLAAFAPEICTAVCAIISKLVGQLGMQWTDQQLMDSLHRNKPEIEQQLHDKICKLIN